MHRTTIVTLLASTLFSSGALAVGGFTCQMLYSSHGACIPYGDNDVPGIVIYGCHPNTPCRNPGTTPCFPPDVELGETLATCA
ncbi:hypothetical protein Tdes44962_MAKER06414 [Teratosphaeria destructans]|uniref:Uncharacterized protein n=1 Tax=Teratosphaeria destructans TaxID=418781 RepID=A0A9W7T1B1_9PEZI|nr:hypothetical protein Tdes44962_MAKER06414 [Teratosphaeria destructans]